jgi:hypothetical protein
VVGEAADPPQATTTPTGRPWRWRRRSADDPRRSSVPQSVPTSIGGRGRRHHDDPAGERVAPRRRAGRSPMIRNGAQCAGCQPLRCRAAALLHRGGGLRPPVDGSTATAWSDEDAARRRRQPPGRFRLLGHLGSAMAPARRRSAGRSSGPARVPVAPPARSSRPSAWSTPSGRTAAAGGGGRRLRLRAEVRSALETTSATLSTRSRDASSISGRSLDVAVRRLGGLGRQALRAATPSMPEDSSVPHWPGAAGHSTV